MMQSNESQSAIKQKNVLITGCSSGVGRALALSFQDRGYKVWATARNLDSIQNLKEKCISIDTLDVTCDHQIHTVVRKILAEDGRIDMLINNAGYGGMGPLVETSGAELERQFATNVFAPMSLIRAVAPAMIAEKSGTIVNIGSISGVLVTPFSGNYCASKAAINALSDTLRMELKPFGVNVVTVQAGAIRSDFANNAGKALDRVWRQDSIYSPIEAKVRKRAQASQDNPTETKEFCRLLIGRLESNKENHIIRIASGSRAFPLFKTFIPTGWLEKIMARFFGLNRLP